MDLNYHDIIEKQTEKRKQTLYSGTRCDSGGRPYTGALVIDCLPSNESGKSKPNYVKNKQNMALWQVSAVLCIVPTIDVLFGMKKREYLVRQDTK